jgi:hypothetical protein
MSLKYFVVLKSVSILNTYVCKGRGITKGHRSLITKVVVKAGTTGATEQDRTNPKV